MQPTTATNDAAVVTGGSADPPGADAPGRVRVRAAGDLDLASSVEILQAVRVALRTRPVVIVLDLSAVSFIDVAGVRAVISCRRMAAVRGVAFELADPSPPVRRLLGLVGLSGMFGVRSELDGLAG